MAIYNNGFPATYQPVYYPQQFQPVQYQQPQPATQQQMQAQQMQQQLPVTQNGFVRVRSENEARMYPVAPGNSVTFVDETAPFCYCKTVNMGQLDRPIFEKYRLVKEDDSPAPVEAPQSPAEKSAPDLSNYATKTEIDGFKAELEAFKADIETFKSDLYGLAGKKKTVTKKEVAVDE